jgi:hypothetical protein
MSEATRARIEDLFLRALELPPAARAGFLDEACADDIATRREVEFLLAADAASDARLRSIVAGAAADVQQGEAERAVGRRIGPYVVEREIGRGGMGTVYLASRNDAQFRQSVAIKVVNRGMDSEFTVARFRRERQVLSDLRHPNIAQLLDGGATEDGLPFFAMEHLTGEPITRYCERKGLAAAERLRLFLQLCAAVQHAHSRLVIHSDIKPGNILVGEDGIPKLLDFGIATLVENQSENSRGWSPMTGRFASPEQLQGERLTTASDIYSMGAVLRELLGEAPARDLGHIVEMAMQAEPARRYATADEMAGDIRRYLELLPVLARPATLGYRAWLFARRRRIALAAAAAIVASLGGGLAAALSQARRADAAREVAEQRLGQTLALSNRALTQVYAAMERQPGTAARAG